MIIFSLNFNDQVKHRKIFMGFGLGKHPASEEMPYNLMRCQGVDFHLPWITCSRITVARRWIKAGISSCVTKIPKQWIQCIFLKGFDCLTEGVRDFLQIMYVVRQINNSIRVRPLERVPHEPADVFVPLYPKYVYG